MNDYQVPTQMILTSNFVKYSRLSELIKYSFHGSKADNINIYIDIYGLMKTLFSDSLRTDISDYTAVTSTIINMCGHYRNFFRNYLGVSSKIFLIFSYNCPYINHQFVKGYNARYEKKMQNRLIREMVELNCNLLEVLCPYLPDIHFIKTDFESSVLIHHLILREKERGNSNPNLIISKDLYPLQITYLHDDTVYIKPKKSYNEDTSTITVPRQNMDYSRSFWFIYLAARNVNRETVPAIHPINVNIISALSRFPERNLDGLLNVPKSMRIVAEQIGSQAVKLYPTSINFDNIKVAPSVVEARYHSLDVEFQYEIYKTSLESKTVHYENLNDVGTINQICAKYFTENPIDLQKL